MISLLNTMIEGNSQLALAVTTWQPFPGKQKVPLPLLPLPHIFAPCFLTPALFPLRGYLPGPDNAMADDCLQLSLPFR